MKKVKRDRRVNPRVDPSPTTRVQDGVIMGPEVPKTSRGRRKRGESAGKTDEKRPRSTRDIASTGTPTILKDIRKLEGQA